MATRWETTRDDDGNRVGVALHFTSLISRPYEVLVIAKRTSARRRLRHSRGDYF